MHDTTRSVAVIHLLVREFGAGESIVVNSEPYLSLSSVMRSAYDWAREAQLWALNEIGVESAFGERLAHTRKRAHVGQADILAEATGAALEHLRRDGELSFEHFAATASAQEGFVEVVAAVYPEKAPVWFASADAITEHMDELVDPRKAFEAGIVMCAVERIILRDARFATALRRSGRRRFWHR